MAQLIAQNLAPIMFAALVIFLLLGYPVAFALAATNQAAVAGAPPLGTTGAAPANTTKPAGEMPGDGVR